MQTITQMTTGTLIQTHAAKINCVPSMGRLSLRSRGNLSPLNEVLGLTLPTKIGDIATKAQTEALCVGPDEWIIVTENVTTIETKCQSVYDKFPHSLVDISGREITFKIEGDRATELLTLGLARDPESIAIGTGRRVFFDGFTVVLWRNEEQAYHMDVWNSFASHIFGLLKTGSKELTADMQV